MICSKTSFIRRSIIRLPYQPTEFQPGRLRSVSTGESRLSETNAVRATVPPTTATDKCTILIYFSIYNNDLHVFVSTLLIISLFSTYLFISMTTFPFRSLIRLIGLSDPWFPRYRSVKRCFTVLESDSEKMPSEWNHVRVLVKRLRHTWSQFLKKSMQSRQYSGKPSWGLGPGYNGDRANFPHAGRQEER
jgi:hypothetical protein